MSPVCHWLLEQTLQGHTTSINVSHKSRIISTYEVLAPAIIVPPNQAHNLSCLVADDAVIVLMCTRLYYKVYPHPHKMGNTNSENSANTSLPTPQGIVGLSKRVKTIALLLLIFDMLLSG